MKNLLPIRIAERCTVDEIHPFHVRIEWPVDSEHDLVGAKLGQAAGQGCVGEVPAGCQVKVLAEFIGESGCPAHVLVQPVATPKHERNRLTEMAEDELELRILLEDAALDQPYGL